MVATVAARERGLLCGPHGADHGGPERLGPLAGDQTDATRRGGITGVPFFLIGDRHPIVGAQSPETMVQVIERVLSER